MVQKICSPRAFYLFLAVVLVLALCASVLTPAPAHAQPPPWPTSWIHIDSDPNEAGPSNDYRDVSDAYFAYDSTYLYLRLETYATPGFPAGQARFKWLIDVGLGDNLYWSGQNILGSDYILMVEDSTHNVYLIEAACGLCTTPYDKYGYYEPTGYLTNPGIAPPADAGYNLPGTGNYVDLYVSFSALGVSGPENMSFLWSTDQQNPNLEQGPILDSTDVSDTPIQVDADLGVIKDVNNHQPTANETITYTVTLTNTGPVTATNIVLTDLLPTGVTFVSYTAPGTYDSVSGNWTVGTLANGDSATLLIYAKVDDPFSATITNTATITAVDQPDPHGPDNSDSTDIYPAAPPDEADLSIIKDVNNHLPVEGDTVTYTFIVTNTGPVAATTINMTDSLPGGITYQSHSASQGNYNSGSGIWSIGTLADGDSATLTVTATVSGTAGLHVFNTATVVGDQNDPHTADNSDDAAFDVQAPASVVVTGVPVFPSMYVGLAAALGAGVLAYMLRRRALGRKTTAI
ncbi:MAG: DUF11 domain-containing protein [Dehalococcoidia bacterium]|nr:DUF11 domain-containing protein [Dehalococcoidia bacterium]